MIIKVYQLKTSTKTSLYTDELFTCSHCNELINSASVVFVEWVSSVKPNLFFGHLNCAKHIKANLLSPISKLTQHFIVEYAPNLPKGCFPIIIDTPNLTNGNFTKENLFTNALNQEVGVTIIDKTKLAFSESLEGAQIGQVNLKFLEEQDASINVDEGLKLLDTLAVESKTVPLLEESKEDITNFLDKTDIIFCQNCGSELSLKKLEGQVHSDTICYECKGTVIFPFEDHVIIGSELIWKEKKRIEKKEV